MNEEPRFYSDAPNNTMLAQLTHDLADAYEGNTILTAIVDEREGGVIAYGLGDENSDAILTALRAVNRDTLFIVVLSARGDYDDAYHGPYLGKGPAEAAVTKLAEDMKLPDPDDDGWRGDFFLAVEQVQGDPTTELES